jgi:hypothetical protein
MRRAALVLLLVVGIASSLNAQIVGTMSELMIHVIYPTSDAVFYISTRPPTTDQEWDVLKGQTLMLAESANLLMLPGHTRDRTRWMEDARLMQVVGEKAFKAAKAHDVPALEALSDELYESCTTCHMHYRPNYGRRPAPGPAASTPAPTPAPAPAPTPSPRD